MPLRQLFNLRKKAASRQWNGGKLKNREKIRKNTQQNARENQHENPAYYRKYYLSSDFLSKAAWEAASSENRLRYWRADEKEINGGLCLHLDTLRQRSRDLVRNNPYAVNAVETWVSNVIGTGIKAHAKAEDRAFRETLQRLWSRWQMNADAQGRSHFQGLQAHIFRHVVESGECLVRFLVDKRDASADLNDPSALPIVPLRLQLLETEHLDDSQDRELPNGHRIQGGIELNRENQRVAYYLYQSHPNENGFTDRSHLTTLRVPASQILHIYRMDHPGQLRGIPWLAPVLLKLYELDQYDDAELMRKKVAAIFAGFVTRPDPESQLFGEGAADRQGVSLAGLEPGTLQFLDPGEDIKFSEPSDVGGNYLDFMRQQLRAIAAGVGITYEQLNGDLTQVNYSSVRAGLIEFRRRCMRLQHDLMVFQCCQPVWERWLSVAFQTNLLQRPKNPRDFDCVQWIPQGFEWVDPLKAFQAEQVAVRNGFKSRADVISELGYEVETVDAQSHRDHERAESFGLHFDSNVRPIPIKEKIAENPKKIKETKKTKKTKAADSEKTNQKLNEPKKLKEVRCDDGFSVFVIDFLSTPFVNPSNGVGWAFRALNAGESANGIPLTKAQQASKTPKTIAENAATPTVTPTLDSRIAVIPVHGLLVHHENPWEGLIPVTSYTTLERQLTQAIEDNSVDRIVLEINSSGGEVGGLFALCEKIYQFASEKSIVAWVNECAFSAAYAIASATSEILMNPTAGVGSIGVITAHVDQSGWDAKQGLHYTLIGAGDHKTDGNAHLPLSEEAKAVYQKEVNYLYDVFISHVARYRVISPDFIRETQAACFWGQAAIDRQLADRLLPFSMGIREALCDHPLEPQTRPLKMNQTRKTKPTHPSKEAFMALPNPTIPNDNMDNLNNRANQKTSDIATPLDTLKNEEIHPEKMAVTLADRQSYRDEVVALCQICQRAQRLDKLAEFIAQDIRLEAAKDILLNELTETLHQRELSNAVRSENRSFQEKPDTEKIAVKRSAASHDNPLWALAKARSRQSLR